MTFLLFSGGQGGVSTLRMAESAYPTLAFIYKLYRHPECSEGSLKLTILLNIPSKINFKRISEQTKKDLSFAIFSIQIQAIMSYKTYASTPRLILREILPEDEDGFYELDSNPAVHRYLGNNPVTDREKIRNIIQYIRQQYIDHGIGRWAMIEKSSGKFIGWCGLKYVTEEINNHRNYYDLGYRLLESHWGNRFATEASKIALDYGFRNFNMKSIYAAAHSENKRSIRVLEHLGFRFVNKFIYDTEPNNWYELKAENRK
jgi:[ribosomal protein S5]-alanine N-acetyltransferase